MTDPDVFNWNPTQDEDHCIVIRHQPGIAVYTNPHDEVVIRQQGDYDEDRFVWVTKDNVLKVAERMLALAGYTMNAGDLGEQPREKSAAARQKRYRQRHRNGKTVTQTVTVRNGSPLLIAAE